MIIFAYDFPHRKTEDFILHCFFNDIKIDAIIATGWKKLKINSVPFKTKVAIAPKYNPEELASKLNIPYYKLDHNSDECVELLNKLKPEVGLITGARILKAKVLNKFSKGVINFHPGDIPSVRGLNSSLRAIKSKLPQVVTAHLIDKEIDLGLILFKKVIEVKKTDTIFDINEKLYHTQLTMLVKAVELTRRGRVVYILEESNYSYEAPFNSLEEFNESFKSYLKL